LAISRDGLNQALDVGELFLADGTYSNGNGWSDTPNGLNNANQHMRAVARAPHEDVNGVFAATNTVGEKVENPVPRDEAITEIADRLNRAASAAKPVNRSADLVPLMQEYDKMKKHRSHSLGKITVPQTLCRNERLSLQGMP
jgi:hypothetical protein